MPEVLWSHGRSQATWTGAKEFRIISKEFIWAIDIKLQSAVTVEVVWDALHTALKQPVMDSEWGAIAADKKLRETVEKAMKRRAEADGTPSGPLRIDWLGDSVVFKGLEKNEDFERARLFPGSEPVAETWVAKFGS
jgi:hypothetical protein